MKIIVCASVVSFGVCASVFLPAGSAHADLCQYPGVGVGAGVILGRGGYCDYPTEINGSHMHCEGGGFGLGGVLGVQGDNGSFTSGRSGIADAS